MASKKIVILGGGYAGIEAAKKLAKKFKKEKNIDITLIDKNPFHTLMTELHEVAGSRVKNDSIRVSFNRIFSGSKVKFELDTIKKIDFKSQTLSGGHTEEYKYDYLVIGSGAEPAFFNIPGVEKHSYKLWSYDDALKLKDRIDSCFLAASREPDEAKRKHLLSFAVAGGGFTGVEMLGELVERKKTLCKKYGLDEKEVSIELIEGLSSICNVLPEKMQKKAIKYLEKVGVKLHLNSFISSVDEGKVTIKNGNVIATGTFIWSAGVKGSKFCENLDIEKNDKDRRPVVNSYMHSTQYENVYFVGDNAFFLENDKPIPKIVETALQTAHVAAYNIEADIKGKPKKEFKSNYHGYMVSIGSKYAVAHVGGMSMSGFPAMAVKHLVNLHYLFGLAGINAIWGYLKHEILNIKERRSLIGEIAAYKIPNYWTLPLRLFLGGKWLYEGIVKIKEGWLNPGWGGFFDPDISAIHLPGVKFGDAVAGASAAAGNAADAVAGASAAAAETAVEYGKPLMEALGIYTWFAENILSISPTFAFIMQVIVVLAEIAVGLALVGGLFTFISAGVSILLGMMFIFSGWGNPELLWYIAAGIVMLGGGGRGFGLDHWVMPFIKRWWNGRKLAQKTYLYLDEPIVKKRKK